MPLVSRRTVLATAAATLSAAEPADLLLTARYVVPMDPQRRVIENGAVALRGHRILAVGPRAEVERAHAPRLRRDFPNGLLLPGLINTHTHAPMSLLRGIADDLRLQVWLEDFIFPAEAKNVTPDFCRWGTRLACLEMALSGTTTYADMYYFEEVIAEATKDAGLRGVLGQTIIRFPVPDAKTPEEGLTRAEAFLQRFANDPLIVPAVAPHAAYTNTDDTLRACRTLANRHRAPLLIHLSETRKENDDIAATRGGMSPTRLLDSLGVLDGRTLAAHAIWTDEQDRAILKAKRVGLAHCPSSNMKLASGVAPVPAYLAGDHPIGLGTDGPAGSNNDFDLMEEMNLAANLQKVSRMDPQAVTALQAVEMATIRGARALGLEREIGSLEPGKKADLIVLSLDTPRAVPFYNAYSQLVYALKGGDVRDVMVNGRWIVRDRRMLTLDRPAILAQAASYANRIRQSLR